MEGAMVYSTSRRRSRHDVLKYEQMTQKFDRACQQIILLNNKIVDCQVRYDRAVVSDNNLWRYLLRLRLMTFEGVRNMIYEYARQQSELIVEMQDELVDAGLMYDEYEN